MNKGIVSVLLLLVMIVYMSNGRAAEHESASAQYNSQAIIDELLSKAFQLDSYAQDFIIRGRVTKRMYFKFNKNGVPFYTFRSEYWRDGKRYVHLFNVNGKYDYHYYPDENVAYRVTTKGSWNDSNYNKAKKWHFDYEGAQVVGEDVVNGKKCYILLRKVHNEQYKFCVWKKYGLQLDIRTEKYTMYYNNFKFNLTGDLFILPGGVKIIENSE